MDTKSARVRFGPHWLERMFILVGVGRYKWDSDKRGTRQYLTTAVQKGPAVTGEWVKTGSAIWADPDKRSE